MPFDRDYPDTELTGAQYESIMWARNAHQLEAAPRKEAGVTPAFLEQLIKRSAEADQVLQLCGCILLMRTVDAAIALYREQTCPPGGQTKEVE